MENLPRNYFRKRKVLKFAYLLLSISIIIILFKLIYLKRSDNTIDFESSDNIDVVYTWVNGSDEMFIATIRKYTDEIARPRFDNKNELKYSIRSLEKFAPWVRHVYIVTNGQIPSWLNLEYEKVSIVPHNQLVQEPDILPTFSSNVIEQFLHRIPNLSKRFLYLNDDIFLGSQLHLEDLYSPSGGFQLFTTKTCPVCAINCPWPLLHDGICQKQCNVAECEFDGNDCIEGNEKNYMLNKRTYDDFVLTLINSGKVFNLAYGLKKRNSLPHIGFLFDKDILEEMFLKFQKEFNNTRYNKFRSINDVQVGYFFVHYVMSEKRNVSVEEIFDRFDLDKFEIWSDDEINLLLEDLRLGRQYFEEQFLNCIKNRKDFMNADGMDDTNSNTLKVTRKLATKCLQITQTLVKDFSKQSKYPFQYSDDSENISFFILLSSNISRVRAGLNKIRNDPRKFNCIGDSSDEKDYTDETRPIIIELLIDFYEELFPYRSKYELPELAVNTFRYYDDYLTWKTMQQLKSSFYGVLCALLIFFILKFCLKLKTSSKKCKIIIRNKKNLLCRFYFLLRKGFFFWSYSISRHFSPNTANCFAIYSLVFLFLYCEPPKSGRMGLQCNFA